MLRPAAATHPRAARHSALSDAVAPIAAALLVPLLVCFALEIPADAIDRIASPFVGAGRAPAVRQQPASGIEWTVTGETDETSGPTGRGNLVAARARPFEVPSAISLRAPERPERATNLQVAPGGTAGSTTGAPPHVGEPPPGARTEDETVRAPQAPTHDDASARGTEPAATGGAGAPRVPADGADEPPATSSTEGSAGIGSPETGAPAAGTETPTAEVSGSETDEAAFAPAVSETVTSGPDVPESTGGAPAPALAQPDDESLSDDVPSTGVSPADPRGDVGDAGSKRRGNSEHAPGHDPAGPGNSEHAPGHGGQGRGNGNGSRGQ